MESAHGYVTRAAELPGLEFAIQTEVPKGGIGVGCWLAREYPGFKISYKRTQILFAV